MRTPSLQTIAHNHDRPRTPDQDCPFLSTFSFLNSYFLNGIAGGARSSPRSGMASGRRLGRNDHPPVAVWRVPDRVNIG